MKSQTWLLVVVATLSMLAGAALFQWLRPVDEAPTAMPEAREIAIQAIPLTALDGSKTQVSDWGSDVLVVNFWAPWCAPCRREIPALIELQREYGDRGLKVLGLAFDSEENVRQFAAEYEINYPLFLTEARSAMYNAAFGNPSGALPFTAIVDRAQNIVYRHNGEVTAEQLLQALTEKTTL